MYKISSWNMILISNDFCHKRKMDNFDPYNVLLAIATNAASVLQGDICVMYRCTVRRCVVS